VERIQELCQFRHRRRPTAGPGTQPSGLRERRAVP
jgi:hypothetical protein